MFKVEKFDSNTEADVVCKKLFSKKSTPLKKDSVKKGKIAKRQKKKDQNNARIKNEIKDILNNKSDLVNLSNSTTKRKKHKDEKTTPKSSQNVEKSPNRPTIAHNTEPSAFLSAKNKRKKRKKKKTKSEQTNDSANTQKYDFLPNESEKNTSQQKLNKIQLDLRKQKIRLVSNGSHDKEKCDKTYTSVKTETTTPKKKTQAKLQSSHNIPNMPRTKKAKWQELTLRERMIAKLQASRFRYLNEQLYSSASKEAQKFFTEDSEAFKAYHIGYRQQVNKWPLNPVDVIIKSLQKLPKSHVIADFGCGEAKIAKTLPNEVHSFDLVAINDLVTPCDMAHVHLKNASVDVAVFCLSLMGTNLHDYLLEANRVLKIGGLLKIAEVESRFDDVNEFIEALKRFNFKNVWKDLSHKLFYFLDFKKEQNISNKRNLPTVALHPCLYKKR